MPDDAAPQPHPDYSRTRHDHSAGGIAYRRTPGNGAEIALIATRGGKRWQLPKGSREENESAQETAIREVEEESGLVTEPEAFLCSVELLVLGHPSQDRTRTGPQNRRLFLLRVVGSQLGDASHEVDGVGWFTFEQAVETLTFKDEVQAAQQACAALTGQDLTGPADNRIRAEGASRIL